jgi:DNA-binding response OmpR family regulator
MIVNIRLKIIFRLLVLQNILLIILTSSSAETDIIQAYNLHANTYIVKPINFDEFMAAIKSIQDFWFKAVTLPPKHAH